MSIKKTRVIVPIFNEENYLTDDIIHYFKSIKDCLSFVVAGNDQSLFILRTHGFHCIKYDGEASIGSQILYALKLIDEEQVLILPVDCKLDPKIIKKIPFGSWGGFRKVYDKDSFFIKLYLFLQNSIRTKMFKNYVWTNGLFAQKKDLLENIVQTGFLEDLILSDNLKKHSSPSYIDEKIIVSYRRYHQKALKRILINLYIILNYRLRLKSIKDLKTIYQK